MICDTAVYPRLNPGGGSSYTLCTGDEPLSRVCVSQILSGKGAVFSPTVWQGYVFHGFCLARVLFSGPTFWQRVCIDPGFIPKFWQGLYIFTFLFWEGWKICLWGRVRVCHPGLHTPTHNLVKSPPPTTTTIWALNINKRNNKSNQVYTLS